jgi:hypothetical protein
MPIIGLGCYGLSYFRSPSPPVRENRYLEISHAIYDEIHIKDTVHTDTTGNRDTWQIPTRLLAKFQGDLEAGSIKNNGIEIVSFALKRRKLGEIKDILIDKIPFVNGETVEYIDVTQPNDHLVYSLVPIGINDLEGLPNEVAITSDFVGWWLVDKETKEVLPFDKKVGDIENVEVSINQGRVQLETLSKYPQIFYTDLEYSQFSLTTVILPSELDRSEKDYQRILDKFIRKHVPFVIKSSDGRLYVCDISNPKFSTPQNSYKGFEYIELTIDCVEIQDYELFMSE